MRISIRFKLTALFVTILGVALVGCILFTNYRLENYYLNEKWNIMTKARQDLSEAMNSDDPNNNAIKVLTKINETSNISGMIILNHITGSYIGKNIEYERLLERIKYYVSAYKITTREQEDMSQYYVYRDVATKLEYLEIYGKLQNENIFILQMPIASVRESVDIATKFFIYLSIIVLVMGGVLIYIVTGSIATPISNLNKISKRMTELDFSAKYKKHGNDELNDLGENINILSQHLETTITELKAANLELQKDIEKKNEIDLMRRDFLSNVTHELKTPIAIIQGFAEGINDGVTTSPEEIAYYTDVILDEAKKMNRMVSTLLNLTQLESGKEQLKLERFDIVELITGIINSFLIMARQEGITLMFPYYEPIFVYGDEYRIEEVLVNYISNAIHHADGKKEVIISFTENAEKASLLRINVFNTGEAIPSEDIHKVWEKFYKVDKARTREYGGNGIGLSIVKAIMDMHRMNYGVANETGGVRFWFEIETGETNTK